MGQLTIQDTVHRLVMGKVFTTRQTRAAAEQS